MPSILFICKANQFRSPLAAALLLKFLESEDHADGWNVGSAGTWTQPGLPAASLAMQVANRLNLPGLNEHRSRPVSQELLDGYDLILVMETGQLEAITSEFQAVSDKSKLLSEVIEGIPYDIPDPVDSINDQVDVASELQMLIEKGGKKILDLAESLHQARNILHERDS